MSDNAFDSSAFQEEFLATYSTYSGVRHRAGTFSSLSPLTPEVRRELTEEADNHLHGLVCLVAETLRKVGAEGRSGVVEATQQALKANTMGSLNSPGSLIEFWQSVSIEAARQD